VAKVSFRKTVNQSKEPNGNAENFNFPQYQTQLSQIYLSHFLSLSRWVAFKRMQHLIFLNTKIIFLGVIFLILAIFLSISLSLFVVLTSVEAHRVSQRIFLGDR
jgi:hypothetical protein